MKNLIKLTVALFALTSFAFAEDAKKESEDSTKWEQIKEEAQEHLAAAIELSKEKWSQIQSFSLEEWEESSKKVDQIKEDLTHLKNKASPELEKAMKEVDELQKKAAEKFKEFSEASGDNAAEAKKQVEKIWKKLEQKVGDLREQIDEAV
jgi:DNA anti-recombination protein RmuC